MNINKSISLSLAVILAALNTGICFGAAEKYPSLHAYKTPVEFENDQPVHRTDSETNVEIAEIMYYDHHGNGVNIGEIAANTANIKVVPLKSSLKNGEEFYVDFVLENNPGVRYYNFSVEYNPEIIVPVASDENEFDTEEFITLKTGEPAVGANVINKEIKKSDSDNKLNGILNFSGSMGSLKDINYTDGVLFRIKFKAVGNGKSAIRISGDGKKSDYDTYSVCNSSGKILPIYMQNARVHVVD